MWSALAPLLAGQPRVRLSRDGGRSYPQKHERDLTGALPSFPAAVRIFGKDGTCAAIFLDFDSSVAGVDLVTAEVRAVTSWLGRCGARWIEDYSPNGGRHVYIPLQERVTFSQARDLVEALGTRYRSLDKTPHQNLLHGCMRVPGSPHKRGGHQELAMSLNTAYDIARRPNTPGVWTTMNAELAGEISVVRALRQEHTLTALPAMEEGAQQVLQGTGRMSRTMLQLAMTGLYDANRYPTDSEARQAVLAGAAAAGLAVTDVQRRMLQGHWPGLASFYARYPARHRTKALKDDWANAVAHVQKTPGAPDGKNNARKNPTSQPSTQGGGFPGSAVSSTPDAEHRFIRTWRNALRLKEPRYRDSRNGLARRMILRALGQAAHMTGSRFVEFGVRSVAVATGLDHTTVATHLRALRSEPESLVTLVESGRGTKGDQYMLTIPEDVKPAAEDLSWSKGKLHALRPVFRELGLPAAFAYEALERSSGPLRSVDLIRASGLSRTALSEALESLAAWNLISRDKGLAWSIVAATSLKDLAERFGVLDVVAGQLKRYQQDRIIWKEWLTKRAHTVAELLSPTDDYPWETFEGPPDDWTLAHMAFTATG
ncbi:MarR family transcriptional regulator [Arthrobacter sp. SRS-W-1-2016]|uniref:MarR family transcriptional regulator n=1 Tax=Arthrobacter sp. SRS-W-1-2016 TaxID=1930254 RepID=UPI001117584F|nr:MarR family transcriptional regulator [Arthrobacter sp. SRS-W-1-2016]